MLNLVIFVWVIGNFPSLAFLMKKGIEVRSGFWPLNQQKGFEFEYVNGINKDKNLSKKIFEKSLVYHLAQI